MEKSEGNNPIVTSNEWRDSALFVKSRHKVTGDDFYLYSRKVPYGEILSDTNDVRLEYSTMSVTTFPRVCPRKAALIRSAP